MDLVNVAQNQHGQSYLGFILDSKDYGLQILKVNEIIVLPKITPLPESPYYLKGVIDLRGQIIPIIDLRSILGINPIEHNNKACVVIVKMDVKNSEKLVGFIVDSVSEVFDISIDNIEKPQDFGLGLDDDFLFGIAKTKEKLIMLLNIDNITETHDLLSA